MTVEARAPRTAAGNLRCRVPGCRAVLRAPTGYREILALQRHFLRVHAARKTLVEVLDTRAEWERRQPIETVHTNEPKGDRR